MVLRFRARGNTQPPQRGFALDNIQKNCYTAGNDGKTKRFLSSSPSVKHGQQFFWMLSRVAFGYHNLTFALFLRFLRTFFFSYFFHKSFDTTYLSNPLIQAFLLYRSIYSLINVRSNSSIYSDP